MSCVQIELEVVNPIMLSLVVDNGFCIIPDAVPAEEPLFVASEAFKFESGDKEKLDAMTGNGLWEEDSEATIRPILSKTVNADYLSGEIYGGLFQP